MAVLLQQESLKSHFATHLLFISIIEESRKGGFSKKDLEWRTLAGRRYQMAMVFFVLTLQVKLSRIINNL